MKIMIVDGNSIVNRAYYGVRPLTNAEGLNTNAIYVFLSIYMKTVSYAHLTLPTMAVL